MARMVPIDCQHGCGRSHLVDSREVSNIKSVTCCVCALVAVEAIEQAEDKFCSAVTVKMIKAAISKKSKEVGSRWTQAGLATHLRIPHYQVSRSCSQKQRDEGFVPPMKLVEWVLEMEV